MIDIFITYLSQFHHERIPMCILYITTRLQSLFSWRVDKFLALDLVPTAVLDRCRP